jgi:hypothetical protein
MQIVVNTVKSFFAPVAPKVTVDTILAQFNQTVAQLEQVRAEREAAADAAAVTIAELEVQRVDSLKEAGRAASVAAKISALLD